MSRNLVIDECFRLLRDHFHGNPCFFRHLFGDAHRWFRATTALNVAEDTWEAIAAYVLVRKREAEPGTLLLELYGLLQATYVQQNALIALFAACEGATGEGEQRVQFRWDDYSDWQHVRTVRHQVVGHPDETESPSAVHGLIRAGLESGRLSYITTALDGAGSTSQRNCDVADLVDKQTSGVERMLRVLLALASRTRTRFYRRLAGSDFHTLFDGALAAVSTSDAVDAAESLNLIEKESRRLKRLFASVGADYQAYEGLSGALDDLLAGAREARELPFDDEPVAAEWSEIKDRLCGRLEWLVECVAELSERATSYVFVVDALEDADHLPEDLRENVATAQISRAHLRPDRYERLVAEVVRKGMQDEAARLQRRSSAVRAHGEQLAYLVDVTGLQCDYGIIVSQTGDVVHVEIYEKSYKTLRLR